MVGHAVWGLRPVEVAGLDKRSRLPADAPWVRVARQPLPNVGRHERATEIRDDLRDPFRTGAVCLHHATLGDDRDTLTERRRVGDDRLVDLGATAEPQHRLHDRVVSHVPQKRVVDPRAVRLVDTAPGQCRVSACERHDLFDDTVIVVPHG